MKLDLTIEQINVVLQNLSQGPYAQVEGLIREIRSQVQPQLVPKEAETVNEK